MSSAAVRTLIFDRTGGLLAEIEPEWEFVAWRLNNVGMARFGMAYEDGKCTRDYLRPGNRLLVQFRNGLPDWGGVIDFPRRRTATGVVCTAYTGEKLLDYRVTVKGRYFAGMAPGYIFQQLVSEEGDEWPTGVEVGSVWMGGAGRSLEYHYHDLLGRIRDLARLTGYDFVVRPEYAGGTLTFWADWFERRGRDLSRSVLLVEDKNLREPVLDEQGPVANRVVVVGEGSTWGGERADAEAVDTDSRNEYGYREYAEVQAGVTVAATLEANAAALVEELAWPRERLALVALDGEPAGFSAYDVGDVVTVQAFLKSAEWAYDGPVRVIGREWGPDGACGLEVETWRAS